MLKSLTVEMEGYCERSIIASVFTGHIVTQLEAAQLRSELSKMRTKARLRTAISKYAPYCTWGGLFRPQLTDDGIDLYYPGDIPSSLRARLKKGIR